jgi:hypothetical protein
VLICRENDLPGNELVDFAAHASVSVTREVLIEICGIFGERLVYSLYTEGLNARF